MISDPPPGTAAARYIEVRRMGKDAALQISLIIFNVAL
jgi:hypothetical protein